jgi:hypothetical protein
MSGSMGVPRTVLNNSMNSLQPKGATDFLLSYEVVVLYSCLIESHVSSGRCIEIILHIRGSKTAHLPLK